MKYYKTNYGYVATIAECDGVEITKEEYDAHLPQVSIDESKVEKEMQIEQLKAELAETDYLVMKAYEGYDMTEYGDWKEKRKDLRDQINALQAQL